MFAFIDSVKASMHTIRIKGRIVDFSWLSKIMSFLNICFVFIEVDYVRYMGKSGLIAAKLV